MESKFHFQKSGNQFRITPKESLDLHEKLPAGTYNVNFDDLRSQFYLETIDDFQLKGKIYGNVPRNSDRIIRTFLERQRSTGVLLAGDKGSGKTLLAQYISVVAAREKGIPTIVINKPWHGDEFNSFIQSISQPAIIFFDEFEKVYQVHSCEGNMQEKVLTLFDGVYSSQKLFLLTANDKDQMDEHMMNRPGRIYYMLEFAGVEQAFIKEYCEDNLHRKDYIPSVCAIAQLFRSFNFDMLKAMVEDMNRYGESPSDVMKFLNIRPNRDGYEYFTVKLVVDGKRVKADESWRGSPLSDVIRIDVVSDDEEEEDGRKYFFSASHLQKLDQEKRIFKFKNSAGAVLVLTPVQKPKFDLNLDVLTCSNAQGGSDTNHYFDDDSVDEEKKLETMHDMLW